MGDTSDAVRSTMLPNSGFSRSRTWSQIGWDNMRVEARPTCSAKLGAWQSFILISTGPILIGASVRKRSAITESKTLVAETENYGQTILMADFARDLARRRAAFEAENGAPFDLPRNSGERRTQGKKALLAEVDRLAAAKGFRW